MYNYIPSSLVKFKTMKKKIAAGSAKLNTTRDSGAGEGKKKRGDKKFFKKVFQVSWRLILTENGKNHKNVDISKTRRFQRVIFFIRKPTSFEYSCSMQAKGETFPWEFRLRM